jgi:hypothetical protein
MLLLKGVVKNGVRSKFILSNLDLSAILDYRLNKPSMPSTEKQLIINI